MTGSAAASNYLRDKCQRLKTFAKSAERRHRDIHAGNVRVDLSRTRRGRDVQCGKAFTLRARHAEDSAMHADFGANLRDWRQRRRMSQLALGFASNVSARHIAFLETGRSKPSRSMVIQLSDALDMPRPARNQLLNAAGFSSAYRSRTLDSAEMAHIRAAVDWTLARHDPYPALAIDRHWNLVAANPTALGLLETVAVRLGDSLLDAVTDGGRFAAAFENWSTVARYLSSRLRTESVHLGGDPVLDRAAAKLTVQAGHPAPDDASDLPPVVTARYRLHGAVLAFFSTIAQFGTAEDMALADLRIELMFPADEATKARLLALSADMPHVR